LGGGPGPWKGPSARAWKQKNFLKSQKEIKNYFAKSTRLVSGKNQPEGAIQNSVFLA
jgi:hypothetical protein